MPILYDAAVEPDDLTIFVREVPVPLEFGLLSEFPTRESDDNTVNFAEIVRTNRTARFRSFDGRVHVSQRDVGSREARQAAAAVDLAGHGRVRARSSCSSPASAGPESRPSSRPPTTTPSS